MNLFSKIPVIGFPSHSFFPLVTGILLYLESSVSKPFFLLSICRYGREYVFWTPAILGQYLLLIGHKLFHKLFTLALSLYFIPAE